MKNLSPEMIEKTKDAKTPEELIEIVKADGIELTAEEAKAYFEQIHSKEIDDDLLDGVAGGEGVFAEPSITNVSEGSPDWKSPCS